MKPLHCIFLFLLIGIGTTDLYAQKASKSNKSAAAASSGDGGSSSGSPNIEDGFHYRMKKGSVVWYHTTKDSTPRTLTSNLKASITQTEDGKMQVTFKGRRILSTQLNTGLAAKIYIDKKTRVQTNTVEISPKDSANNFYLPISRTNLLSDYTYFRSIPYSALQYGATTIPFKYHPGFHTTYKNKADTIESDFSTGINVALYIGWKIGWTRFYYDKSKSHNTISFMGSAFFGPSTLSIDGNTFDNEHKSSQGCLTGGVGISAELNNLNFGIFTGTDISQKNIAWYYSKKIWFGFGIGFNLGMFTNGQKS